MSFHATTSLTFYSIINCFNDLYFSKTHLSRRLLFPLPIPKRSRWSPATTWRPTFFNCSCSSTLDQPPAFSNGSLPGNDLPRALPPLEPIASSNSHNLGACDVLCPKYHPSLWIDERSDGSARSGERSSAVNPKFITCSANGVVQLLRLTDLEPERTLRAFNQ